MERITPKELERMEDTCECGHRKSNHKMVKDPTTGQKHGICDSWGEPDGAGSCWCSSFRMSKGRERFINEIRLLQESACKSSIE